MTKAKTNPKHYEVHIVPERCKGCSFCIEFCPQHILYYSTKTNSHGYHLAAISDSTKCTGCDWCSLVCPEFAIYVASAKKSPRRQEHA